MSTVLRSPLYEREGDTPTVSQAFDDLLQGLQIEQWKPIASKQQQELRRRLEWRIALVDSFLTGSYRRNTQIFPLDDIDVLVVLDADEYAHILADSAGGPDAALDLVEAALRSAYPKTEIERFNCCLRIQFAGTGIGFDVIPVFQQSEDVFLMPNTDLRRWVPTNPKEHQRLVSEANQNVCGGMLVPLVKLLKACNESMGKPISGFHVEMMAYYALRHVPLTHRAGVAYLLNDFATRIWSEIPDPWPLGRPVDEYLGFEERLEAATKIRGVAEQAADAIRAEERGDAEDAHSHWREVFGELYPVSPPAVRAMPLPFSTAARTVSNSGRISATSAGLVGLSPGYASVRTATSHGGLAPHRVPKWSGLTPNVAWHEREIEKVRRQFTALERLTPAEAAADPALWPVREEDIDTLYAVLLGDQHTNLGIKHRLLILIPKDAPAVEPAFYDLRPYQPAKITASGWKPKRGLMHHWGGGVLCTHAARDRWNGQLVTLTIWAVDWLFRQDYRQRFGKWLGPQIDRRGRYVLNGVVQDTDPRLRRGSSRGRRVLQ